MNHQPIPESELNQLTLYVTGELDHEDCAKEKAQIEQRLTESAELREELELLRATFSCLQSEAGEPPVALDESRRRVLQATAAAQTKPMPRLWIPMFAAAGLIVAVVFAFRESAEPPDYSGDMLASLPDSETGEVVATGTELGRRNQVSPVLPSSSDAFIEIKEAAKRGSEQTAMINGDQVEILRSLGYLGGAEELEETSSAKLAELSYVAGSTPKIAFDVAELEQLVALGYLDDSNREGEKKQRAGYSIVPTETAPDPSIKNRVITVRTGEAAAAATNPSVGLVLGKQVQDAPAGTPATNPPPQTTREPLARGRSGGRPDGSEQPIDLEAQLEVLGYTANKADAKAPALVDGVSHKTELHAGGVVQVPAQTSPVPMSEEAWQAAQFDLQEQSDEQLQVLRSLGYIGGSGSSDEDTYEDYVRRTLEEVKLKDEFGFLSDDDGDNDFRYKVRGDELARLQTNLVNTLALAQTPKDFQNSIGLIAAARGFMNTASTETDQAAPKLDCDSLVNDILSRLARHPGESPDVMFFRYWGDNPFEEALLDHQSTFSMDVDTASYSLVRNYLSRGTLPPKAAVRTEEFLNSFDYRMLPPGGDSNDAFAIHLEAGPSPFGQPNMKLLRVGCKAKELVRESRKPVALTFVIDVSGSMDKENRLKMVQQSLRLLVSQLGDQDTIGIITFRDDAQRILEPHSMQYRDIILGAIDGLHASGSTNAGDGLRLGYEMANRQYRADAENRVILCSDGVANTGITDEQGILRCIDELKQKQIFLNSVGVGMGNHNDALLEGLANRGDGRCDYVDSLEEAKRIFVDDFLGTMLTVAKDAKIQVEFNSQVVQRYRLLGYENRAVRDQDFRNDAVDAGEVGSGHEVTALYELQLVPNAEGYLATVRLRYQDLDSNEVREQSNSISAETIQQDLMKTSTSFRLAACVGEFAELFRQSIWARSGSFGQILSVADIVLAESGGDSDVAEFVALVRQAGRIPDLMPAQTEISRLVEELKRNQHLKAMVEELKNQQNQELWQELQQENNRLEDKFRDLLRQQFEDC